MQSSDVEAYGVRVVRKGKADTFVDLEWRDGSVVVHAADGVDEIVLAKDALGATPGAPVKLARRDVVVRWER